MQGPTDEASVPPPTTSVMDGRILSGTMRREIGKRTYPWPSAAAAAAEETPTLPPPPLPEDEELPAAKNPRLQSPEEKLEASFLPFTPEDYAFAVFGEYVSREQVASDPVVPSGVKPKDKVGNEQWTNAMNKVTSTLKLFNMEVQPIRKKLFASNLNLSICRPSKRANRACRFFCSKCAVKGEASLIAAGTFVARDSGNVLKMNVLFPHNSNCCQSVEPLAPQSPYTVIDFDFDTVIGDTYSAATDEINKQKVGSKDLTGSAINFDDVNHDSDDRSYFALPRPNDNSLAHKHCMARLFLHMSVKLNLVEETVAKYFDWNNVEENRWVDYPVKENRSAHLFMSDISLLFGGHNLKKNGPLQYQSCQVDVDGLERCTALGGRSKPGSIILPLVDHRSIYVGQPGSSEWELITIYKGQYICFEGDFPHGCSTHEKASLHTAAIHLHVDTIHHERTLGTIMFVNREEEAMERLVAYHKSIAEIKSTARENGWEECLSLCEKLLKQM
jgi:hypothetical protein